MDENYSDPGDSDGGSTPVQDEHEDFEDDGLPEGEEDVAVSPVASPKENEENEENEREEEGEIADDDEIDPEEQPESEERDWKGEVASDGEVGEVVSDVESEREHEEIGEVQSEDEARPVDEDGGYAEDQGGEFDPISPKEEDQEEGEFDSSKEEESLVEGHAEVREENEDAEYSGNISDGEAGERIEEAEEKEEDGGLGDVDEVSADEDEAEGREDEALQVAHDMEEETEFGANESKEQEEEEEEGEEGEVEMTQEDTPVSPASNIDSPEEFDDQKENDMERVSEVEDNEAGEAENNEKDEDAEDGITHQRQESDHEEGEDDEDDRKGALGDTEMYEGAEQVSEDEDQQEEVGKEDGEEKTQSDGENQEAVSDKEAVPSPKVEEKPMSPVHGLDAVSDNEDDDDDGLTAKPSKEAESGEESDEEKELIADIFGSSDEEGEEFEGFGEKDLEPASKKRKSAILSSDDDDDVAEPAGGGEEEEEEEGEEQGSTLADILPPETKKDEGSDSDEGVEPSKGYQRADFVSDFDLMMEKKKAEMGKRRKRRDVDIINDNDDIIMAMITQMKEAAEADQELNKERKAAVKKLLMYPRVMQQLQKADLQQTLLECGILSAMKEWLMPLPDKSLPHLKIRTQFLKILKSFPPISQDLLKSSGVGKAVMILYRHPKELRANKDLAGRIINNWSRPIFGVDDSFLAMSKEERQHRDLAQLSAVKRRRMSSQDGDRPKTIERALQQGEKALRPGDKGWIGRARVPMPSNKDYLVRPKSMVEAEFSARSFRKPPPSKLDKQLKKMKAYKAKSKSGNLRAINVNIAGAKMSL